MIEIIRQTEHTEENLESKLPKNIRQIGNPEKDFRIYMEDYVYTYLHPAQIQGMQVGIWPRMLILLGEINHFSNRSCAFISGAIQVENAGHPEELPELNDRTWRQIHKEIQTYFEKCEIVGWVLDIPGNTLEITKDMEELHRKNFVSPYQFFFLMDSQEREEAFYTWKAGKLARKEGYFIYYEKNPQMQEYMISKREAIFGERSPLEEVEDQATRNYRAMMLEKKEHTYKRRTGILSYITSVLMVVVLCSVSVILLGSIHRMENMEETITTMSTSANTTEQEIANEAHQVAVETVSGSILPVGASSQQESNPNETAIGTGASNQSEATVGTDTSNKDEATQNTGMQDSYDAITSMGASQQGRAATNTDTSQQNTSVTNTAPSQQNEVATSAETEAERYRAQGYYIVQQGDSLQQISQKIYRTDAMIGALCEANSIADQNSIFVGQKIILP